MVDSDDIMAGDGGTGSGLRADQDSGTSGSSGSATPSGGSDASGNTTPDDPITEAVRAVVEDPYELRLTALLHQLVSQRGHKGAARALGIDHRTVASSVRQGLSRRVREALERSLVEKDGDARDRLEEEFAGFRERFEALAGELRDGLTTVQGQMETLGEQQAGRMRRLEGRVAQVEGGHGRSQGTGAAASAGSGRRSSGAGSVSRRRYPALVSRDAADDDAEVFGDAWPLVEDWRRLWDGHPALGRGLAWVSRRERILALEVAMLEDHGLTLPPETEPLRGLDRGAQLNWRKKALADIRRRRARLVWLRRVRCVLTLGLWWR